MAALKSNEFITLARVVKTQGRHGEVAVELHSDVPDRLHQGLRLFALAEDDSRHELKIEAAWPHKGFVVLKFAGCESISEAEALVGCELQVPRSERVQLRENAAYVSDLVGCELLDSGRPVGTVSDVRFGAGEAPLLVVGAGKGELEIPFAQEFLVRVDVDTKRIEMNLPEGLMDVNAPLTEQEKRRQKKQKRLIAENAEIAEK